MKLSILVVSALVITASSTSRAEWEACRDDSDCAIGENCLLTQEEYGTRQCIANHRAATWEECCPTVVEPGR